MRTHIRRLLAVVLSAASIGFAVTAAAAPPPPITVLVTNDDGVGAPGIDALVNKLLENPNLTVVVVAPATNQSGSGDQTSSSVDVSSATTASAVAATAVAGFPADSVIFALREQMPTPPQLVVSGINAGQNIGSLVPISGTVGAALWAARLGVPAIAVSQGFLPALTNPTSYTEAALYTANVVERFRKNGAFRKMMRETDGTNLGLVLNINFPSCSTGATRGVRLVPRTFGPSIQSYNLVSSMSGVDTWSAVDGTSNPFATNCLSTFTPPLTDVQAMNNGYASVSLLSATGGGTSWKPGLFKFLQKIKFQ